MSHTGRSLLIVEDTDLVIRRLQAILEGYQGIDEVIIATGYADAMSLLSSRQPSIVLLDIHLADGNGVTLLRYIRKHYPHIDVIMMSNQADAFYRDYCKALGARYFIDKSSEFNLLLPLLSSLP